MKYKDEVPKTAQIALNLFRLLPGDSVLIRYKNALHHGRVVEVGSANPEYVLHSPRAKAAGIIRWRESERAECERFFRNSHSSMKIRLKRSVWAVVEIHIPQGLSGHLLVSRTIRRKLYTYDIERLVKKCWLKIIGP